MQIKNRQRLLGITAIAALGLLAADKLIVNPLSHAWKERSKAITELRKQIATGRQLLLREQSWRSRWQHMRTNTLPNNPSLAEQQVLKAFDQWAQDSRISILSISPQWKHDSDDYTTLQCRVEASGNLTTVSRFLYDLEKDSMALRLDNVEISARDNEGQQLNLGLQISGLVLASQEQKQ